MTISFSANLGFLWTDLPLPDAILAAGASGFDAVECHMPFAFPASEVVDALHEAGLEMLTLNTRLGPHGLDDFGLTAQPGRESEARENIDEAIVYAVEIGCRKINVLAGRTGGTEEADAIYRANLSYATEQAAKPGVTILIEPISGMDDYHLTHVGHAVDTIEAVGADNLKILFDCFHTQIVEGEVVKTLERSLSHVGHVQFASVPDRTEPDHGDLDYSIVLPALVDVGYDGLFGAEYHPRSDVFEGLTWLESWREKETTS